MKFTSIFPFVLICFFPIIVLGQESWTIGAKAHPWSREGEITATLDEKERVEGSPSLALVHTGNADWALSEGTRISVVAGEQFQLTGHFRVEEGQAVRVSVVLRRGEEVFLWMYGGKEASAGPEWQELSSRFMIPNGVDNVELRVTGHGPTKVRLAGVSLTKEETKAVAEKPGAPEVLENEYLKVTCFPGDGTFSVEDRRTGKVRSQIPVEMIFVRSMKKTSEREVVFELTETQTLLSLTATVSLEADRPEVVVRVHGDPEAPATALIMYPCPFESRSGERVILPLNEGISFPVEEEAPGTEWLYFWGGHGLCMAFYGQVTDELDACGSDGFLACMETPDDAIVKLTRQKQGEGAPLLAFSPGWSGQKLRFGYDRVIRFCFSDQGGYVALCKWYREYVKKTGLCVTFEEKVKRNPALAEGMDLLIGAANIWSWDSEKLKLVHEMQEAGMDRILWSGSGSPEEIKAMNGLAGVLTSRYDIYQDMMDPALIPRTAAKVAHDDWTQDAWPHDVNWSDANGTMRTGWSVEPAEQGSPRIPCVVLCDRQAYSYAQKRIAADLAERPFRARFLDTTTAAPWQECWCPDHPMTRSEGKFYKMRVLELLGKEFHLVCGSETGHEAAVPYCDFFEGMMSLGPYRVPESGRDMMRKWDEVPENLAKYQLGPEYRLPLWELVYHDCMVSYWYWGDYNNKLPSVWWKRDLFNSLYGVPPMYMFTGKEWQSEKERFVASYKVAEPVSRATGRSEMTGHRILTGDRLVQETTFACGVRVITNFGEVPYTSGDGVSVAPRTSWVTGLSEKEKK